MLFVDLDGFGVEEGGGVGAFVGDGEEFGVDGFEGGWVVFGVGGGHEVAVALFASGGGGEAFSGGPGGLVGCVGLEGELGDAVRGVVDGDDGVGDGPVGVGPGVGVADPAERGPLDECEGVLEVSDLPMDFRGLVGLSGVAGVSVEVGFEVGADAPGR